MQKPFWQIDLQSGPTSSPALSFSDRSNLPLAVPSERLQPAVAGFDHRFSLGHNPEAVDRRLIPDGFAVFLHLETDLRFFGTHRLQEHYSERVKHPISTRH